MTGLNSGPSVALSCNQMRILCQKGAKGVSEWATGAAGTAILGIATERNANLIVVGTVGRTGLRRALLGSVAETVVKNATCSVLVVRQHPE